MKTIPERNRMNNLSQLVRSLVSFITPFLPFLMTGRSPETAMGFDPYDWKVAVEIWGLIEPKIRTSSGIQEVLQDASGERSNEDALASLRFQLKRMLEYEPEIAGRLTVILRDSGIMETAEIVEPGDAGWADALKDEPVMRRLEMIRLLRSGTPLRAIARQYQAVPEYITRLDERFRRHGLTGILTEDDFQRFRAVYPEVVRISTYNLQGVHGGDAWMRFRRIAGQLSAFDVDLASFQEVISGNGVEETSAQVARWMSRITGYNYRTSFSFCHLYMDQYPEGVSVMARHGFRNIQVIDLNKGLWIGLAPSMDRFALAAEVEIYGKRIVFTTIHLDHENPRVRLAQAEKLLMELDRLFGEGGCFILAGDFNDEEDSPVMAFLKASGYRDAYRSCNPTGGETFVSSDPQKRIDYIMVRGNVNFLSSVLAPTDSTLSDHIGVMAEMKIK